MTTSLHKLMSNGFQALCLGHQFLKKYHKISFVLDAIGKAPRCKAANFGVRLVSLSYHSNHNLFFGIAKI